MIKTLGIDTNQARSTNIIQKRKDTTTIIGKVGIGQLQSNVPGHPLRSPTGGKYKLPAQGGNVQLLFGNPQH